MARTNRPRLIAAALLNLSLATATACVAAPVPVTIDDGPAGPRDVDLVNADLFADNADAKVVRLAAGLLAGDVERVTGHRPAIKSDAATLGRTAVLIGTLGQSPVIDRLAAAQKIDAAALGGKTETFGWFVVEQPAPGVDRALVVVGSDRRGTAYGVVELSRRIGVSPWSWWADVPPAQHAKLRASGGSFVESSPKVRYRGIFINDEDWGLRPWAYQTDDPGAQRVGPKTYAKVFELMLRLRLNYLWPAMHPGTPNGSGEFTDVPGNAELADDWAVVTGSSHCEPMLRNNVYWDKSKGPWRYDTNTKNIHDYWQWSAVNRGPFESVWTLGIRGIHDTGMSGPKALPDRVAMMENIFADQRQLIADHVTKSYGPPAECFVPYKEVLPLYNAGLKVPDDVTIVWPDDNFGYIRRLATPEERKRRGGTGVYYHFSYWGSPHSYLWVETTSPGLTWEEMHKAYVNGSQQLWVVNVGDIKPAEIAIDFWSRLAWDPDAFGPDAQRVFLDRWCADTFGAEPGPRVHALLDGYYKLAARMRPEHFSYQDPATIPPATRGALLAAYDKLLADEEAVAAAIPADHADAYFETVGYAARALALTGRLYLGEAANQKKWKDRIDADTTRYNEQVAGGKWNHMMSTTQQGMQWPVAVGGKLKPLSATRRGATQPATDDPRVVVDAADATTNRPGATRWTPVAGLGWSGRAVTLLNATPDASTSDGVKAGAASLAYDFELATPTTATIGLDALPTMRLTPDGHLRLGVSVDGKPPLAVDIPGGEADGESSPARAGAVKLNRQSFDVPLGDLPAGRHTLTITAIDPGVVLDQIRLPAGATRVR